jgi:hypothetical protein
MDFFRQELQKYDSPDLLPLGKKIIDACLNGASVQDYEAFIPSM